MLNKTDKYQIFIALISIATLILSGCASPGYQRVCDWCDDASKEQLKRDVAECNAISTSQVPYNSITRKTGRIVTSHGSTSCTTSKRGNTTCSTGSTYTYPEEETVDITNYEKRKNLFTVCTDLRAKNYRAKDTTPSANSSQGSSAREDSYNWDLKTPPEDIEFSWTKANTWDGKELFFSMNRSSIQVNGDRRVFWALQHRESDESVKIRSMMLQMELDCRIEKMRMLVAYSFAEPMGKGEMTAKMRIPSDKPQGAWKAAPGTNPFVSKICSTD